MILKQIKIIFFLLIFALFSMVVKSENLVEVKNVKVIRIIDGDTIVAEVDNKQERIRFMGIQAPELFTDPPEDFSFESKEEVERLLQNKYITIKYTPKYKRDKYKRILADLYVEDSNLWVNGHLIEKGLAFTYILNRNPIPFVKELLELESKAIADNLTFWQNENYRIIDVDEIEKHMGEYKLVRAEVKDIINTKNSTWIQLTDEKYKGFSLRIDRKHYDSIASSIDLTNLIGKKIIARGFIDKYSPKYGAFIDVVSPYMIETL